MKVHAAISLSFVSNDFALCICALVSVLSQVKPSVVAISSKEEDGLAQFLRGKYMYQLILKGTVTGGQVWDVHGIGVIFFDFSNLLSWSLL